MLNGAFKTSFDEKSARLDTIVLAKRGRELPISLCLTKQTSIMASNKSEDLCVVFLSGEHVIIKEKFKYIKSVINNLK